MDFTFSPTKVLKATLLSGRSCIQVVRISASLEDILQDCGASLGLERTAVLNNGAFITSDGATLSSMNELQPATVNEVTLVLPS